MSMIFFVIIYDDADSTSIILRHQDICSSRQVLAFFQEFLNTAHCFIGYFSGLSVNHIGNGGCTQPQFICDITNSHPVFCHNSFLFQS